MQYFPFLLENMKINNKFYVYLNAESSSLVCFVYYSFTTRVSCINLFPFAFDATTSCVNTFFYHFVVF